MAALGAAIVFAAVVGVIIYWILKFRQFQALVNKLPGPRTLPLLGNAHQFKPDPDAWFDQAAGCSAIYTNPRLIRLWLTVFPYISIHGAEEAEVILSSNKHINKGREYRLFHPWLGLGLLTNYAEPWRPRRKLLTPTFHYDILKDFMEVFNKESKILVELLAEEAKTAPTTNIYGYITRCALDIICESAMGQNVNAQRYKDSQYVTAVYKLNDILHQRQKQPWFWIDFLFKWLGRGKEHEWCLKVVHGFSHTVIDKRYAEIKEQKAAGVTAANGKKRKAFLDLLLDLLDEGKIPMADLRNEVDTFMFEGHDTTSAGMNWCLYLLGLDQDLQAKVHKEIDAMFGDEDRDIGYDDLKNLSYLECCIKEALRLFPSVPIYARTLSGPCNIVGYEVPASTQVAIFPYSVHRDPKHWPDPEVFDPDRFLPENAVNRHPFAYLPFSAGNRNCIGQRFAIMEEKTVLAWVLRYFQIRSVHRRDQVRVKAELILRPVDGVHLELKLRRPIPA